MLRSASVLIGLLSTAPAAAHAATFEVGVLVWSSNIPGQVAMRAGLESQARAINAAAGADGDRVRLDIRVAGDGAPGIERQIGQMNAMVDAGVDLIIVQPTDNAALAEPLQAANAAGIPVVAYDQYIVGGQLSAYLTSDNRQAGIQDGEYIAARFPDDRVLRLVLVEYPAVSSTVERLDGFLDALSTQGQPYDVVGIYQGVDPDSGAQAARQLLADHPEVGSVDVVFTVNDGGGLAVVDALVAAGRDEIVVATIDGDPTSVDNIRAGRLTVIDSAQFCGPLGAETMKAAWRILQGDPPPEHLLVPTFPITAETLDEYPGWTGPLPASFVKPWPAVQQRWTPDLVVAAGQQATPP